MTQMFLFETERSFKDSSKDFLECKSCGESFPYTRDFFSYNSTTRTENGETKEYLHKICKTCKNELTKERNMLKEKHKSSKSSYCHCCKKTTDKLCLDHDHNSGEFRGWLCNDCNTGLGLLGDTKESLQRALQYLTEKENT